MNQNKIVVWVLTMMMLIALNKLVQAQKQNNQWRFGYGGGIDFNFCPPIGTDGG